MQKTLTQSVTRKLMLISAMIMAMVISSVAVVGQTFASDNVSSPNASFAPQSKACDWFGVCGHFYNGGNNSIRATCDWTNKTKHQFWVAPRKKSQSTCRDTDGVYVYSGWKIQHRYPETLWRDKFTSTGWHKISDSFSGHLRIVRK